MKNIYTIGHSVNTFEKFLKLLRKHKVNCIIDVRSTPFSKYAPQYNKENIKALLNKHGIYYIFMGEEFGARRKESELYNEDGLVDFEKVGKSALFENGVQRVNDGIEKGYNISFMCTEKDPISCHRCILVGREFHKIGYNVCNIMPNGDIQTQDNIEQRLLDMYYRDRNQISLFSNASSEEELINKAYKLQNKEVGYHVEGDDE